MQMNKNVKNKNKPIFNNNLRKRNFVLHLHKNKYKFTFFSTKHQKKFPNTAI